MPPARPTPETAAMPDLCVEPPCAALPAPATPAERAGQFARRHAGLAAVLVFAVCFLRPLLDSGFICDDVPNSYTAGLIRLGEGGLKRCIHHHNRQWMDGGRFFPVAVAITYAVHAWLITAAPYKCFVVALVLVNLVQFYYLLRLWKVPPALAQLGTLTLVLLLQMRCFPDPLLSFAGILQVVAGEFLFAAICLQKYLDTERRGWLVAGAMFFGCSLITYEISYALLPVLVVMAYLHYRRWATALTVTRPHWITSLLLGAYVLGLRFHVPMPDDHPYKIHWKPNWVFDVLYRQSASALPLSYSLSTPYRPNWDFGRLLGHWENWFSLAGAGGLTLALCWTLRADEAQVPGRSLRPLAVLGLMTWILPALPIAFSSKYHQWVSDPGLGYLPVYVQYFGVAMLAVVAMSWLAGAERWRRPLAAGLLAANGCVALVTCDTNRHVVEMTDRAGEIAARRNLEVALSAGVCDMVPEGSTLLTTRWRTWMFGGPPYSSALFTQMLGRRVQVVSQQSGPPGRPLREQLAKVPTPTFAVFEHTMDGRTGFVIVGRLEPAADGADAGQTVRTVRIFLRGALTSMRHPDIAGALTGWTVAAGNDGNRLQQRLEFKRLGTLKWSGDWAIQEGTFSEPVDLTTLEVVATTSPTAPQQRFVSTSPGSAVAER